MEIVPQSTSSLCFSVLVPSILLLAAPRIAGLLPARAGSDSAPADTFTYRSTELAALAASDRTRILENITALLDTAIRFVQDKVDISALLFAEDKFHQALSDTARVPPEYQRRADIQDKISEFMEDAQERIAARYAEIEEETAAMRLAHGLDKVVRRDRSRSTCHGPQPRILGTTNKGEMIVCATSHGIYPLRNAPPYCTH